MDDRFRMIVVAFGVAVLAGGLNAGLPSLESAGRVVDEKDQPVAGARVVVITVPQRKPGAPASEDRQVPAFTTTGPDGRFRFPPGTAHLGLVVASKEGTGLDWALFAPQGGSPDGVLLRLSACASVQGQVVDQAGQPIAGATVCILLRLGPPRSQWMSLPFRAAPLMVRTDSQGRFRFDLVPWQATAGFDISAPGRARVLADGDFTPGQKGLRFVLPPEGRIEGVVVEKATARPLAGLAIQAHSSLSSGFHFARARTDTAGRFRMEGLSAGKYEIQIESGGAAPGEAPAEWIARLTGMPVENGAAASPRLEALRAGCLEIALADPAGHPPSTPGYVTVSPVQDRRISASGLALKDGRVHIALTPGTYVVSEVQITGYSCKPEPGRSFAVQADKTARARLTVTPVPQVCLAVVDDSAQPVAHARASLIPMVGPPKDLAADADGRLTIASADIGPFFCFLWVRHPKGNLSILTALAKDANRSPIVLCPPARVEGTVRDSLGRPLAAATVRAQIDASHMGRYATLAITQTDPAGRYRLDLPTGMSFAIIATAPGFGQAEKILTDTHMTIASTRPADPPGRTDLVLTKADRTIRGLAVDAAGRAVPGVILTTRNETGQTLLRSVVSDENGRFVLEQVSAEPFTLLAKAPGRGWIGNLTVSPEDKEVTIPVQPSHYD